MNFKADLCIKAVIFLLLPAFAGAQSLSQAEQKIASAVERSMPEAISFLEKTVNIESPTEDIAGVKADGMLFKRAFEALGMNARWVDMPVETKRAGHLIAQTRGTRGKRILLIGHLDTVLRGERFRREGDRAFGTGIADMKGGNVIILYALRALQETGVLADSRITVVLTGDEEDSCEPVSLCRGDLIEAAKASDLALSFEGGIGDTATVGRRGVSSWAIEIEAQTGHSSAIFRESMGNGAIFEAARILNEMRLALGSEKYLTVNPGLILGGTTVDNQGISGSATGKTNVVAAKVTISGDLRYISRQQEETARQRLREIVSKSLSGAKARITFQDGIPAMAPVEGNYELLQKLDRASRDLGLGPVEALDPGQRGAGDIAFIAELLPGLDGLGMAGGENSHAKGESADLSKMPIQIKRAALLIYRLTR